MRHATRERLTGREPVLITLKVRPEIRSLRARRAFTHVVRSLVAARERFGVRLTQFSVQRDHVHLVVEAERRAGLARAMQGLCVRIARALNRMMGRKGAVFADRYHDRVLRTPRQVRHALRYVLCNGRKHAVVASDERFDPCSSAAAFDGWKGGVAGDLAASLRARVVARPRTWLLTIGWRRGGLLDPWARPGPLSARSSTC